MERLIHIHVEKLPEGVYLATSKDVQGLVAQGSTIEETLEIAKAVASELIKMQSEDSEKTMNKNELDSFNCALIVNV